MTQLFRSNNHVALSRNLLPEALCPLATTGGRQCPVILRWPNRCMGMKEADNLKVGSIRVKSQKTLIWLPIPPERSLSQIASMYLIICSGTLIAGWIFANADHFMQRTCQCSARGDIQLSICLVPDSSATMYFLGTQHWSLFDQERERERESENVGSACITSPLSSASSSLLPTWALLDGWRGLNTWMKLIFSYLWILLPCRRYRLYSVRNI